MPLIAELLARRVRSDGAAPLVTYYDTASGARTELSAITLANWVAKTSNLLTDELVLPAGAAVELRVAVRHPGHWMTLVWVLACWQTGTAVTVGHLDDATVVVGGPEDVAVDPGSAELVVCSLHPLGLGLQPPVPAGVLDYATEVRGQPDRWSGVPARPVALAWVDADRELTQATLTAEEPEAPQRVLVRPGDPWATVRAALVVPLRDGGSSVVLDGPADAQRVEQLVASERVDVVVSA